jgi:TPR repeat protein
MGYIYSTGHGAPKNLNLAVQWWRKAAEQNLAEAQNALGQFYFLNEGGGNLNTNCVEAAKWFRKAALQGNAFAMNNLGVMYDYGRGVPRNWSEAAKWYRKAAELGDASAQGSLGVMYLDGRGVTNDLVQAYAWFVLSAEKGNGIGRNYFYDFQRRQLLTTNQLAEAQMMVEAYRDRHVGQP